MVSVALAILTLVAPVSHVRSKEPARIDLASAYSTVEMKSLKLASRGQSATVQERVEEVRRAASRAGLSAAFLVGGEDFGDAALATTRVFGGGGKAGEVVYPQTRDGGDIWVCAFLGNGSTTPPSFAIRRIEVVEQVVRVVFFKPRNVFRSCDHAPFLIWANLGQLAPGTYRVELVDGDQNDEVTVSRRVLVKPIKK